MSYGPKPPGNYYPPPYPPPPPQSSGNGIVAIVLGIVAVVIGIPLLACCGLAGYVYYQGSRTVEHINTEVQRAERRAEENRQSAVAPPAVVNVPHEPTINNVDTAVQTLKTGNVFRQEEAARWLASQPVDMTKQAEVREALRPLLTNHFGGVAREAMNALAVWGTAEDAPIVVEALNDRRIPAAPAIRFLGERNYVEGAEVIANHLDRSGEDGEAAVAALQQIGPAAQPHILKYLDGSGSQADERTKRILQSYGADVHDAMITRNAQILAKLEHFPAMAAADWLAKAEFRSDRQTDVARAIDAALATDDGFIKRNSIKAALIWADKDNVPAILKMLESDPFAKRDCLLVLAKLNDPRAIEPACKFLAAGEGDDAAAVLAAIGPEAQAAVLSYMHHPDGRARERARDVLTDFGTDGDLLVDQTIADLKSNETPRIQAALEWLKEASIPEDKHEGLGAALLPLTQHKDFRIPTAAYQRLIQLRDPRVVEPLGEMIGNLSTQGRGRALFRETGEFGEEIAIKLLEHKSPDVRTGACYVLMDIGTAKAIPALQAAGTKAERAREGNVVTAARSAIMTIGRRQMM